MRRRYTGNRWELIDQACRNAENRAQRLRMADSYLATVADPVERMLCAEMIETWQAGREKSWPSHSAMTLPMRQCARILRGQAIHIGAGALEPIQ